MDFPVAAHTDPLEFRRDMASIGCLGQTLACLLEFVQQMVGPVTPVGFQNVFVDSENILFGIRNHEHLIIHGRFLVRAVMSANAFFSGLCLPASALL
jgi:hypothetical protein